MASPGLQLDEESKVQQKKFDLFCSCGLVIPEKFIAVIPKENEAGESYAEFEAFCEACSTDYTGCSEWGSFEEVSLDKVKVLLAEFHIDELSIQHQ